MCGLTRDKTEPLLVRTHTLEKYATMKLLIALTDPRIGPQKP